MNPVNHQAHIGNRRSRAIPVAALLAIVAILAILVGAPVSVFAQQTGTAATPGDASEQPPVVLPQIAIPVQSDLPVVIPVLDPSSGSGDASGPALPDILIPEPEINLALFLPDAGPGITATGGQVLVRGRLGGGLFGLLAGSIDVARYGVAPRFRITFDHRSTNAALAGSSLQPPGTAWFTGADELGLWLNLQPLGGNAEFTADFASRRRGMQGLGGLYATESRLIAGSAVASVQPDPLVVLEGALRGADIGRFQALVGSTDVPSDGRTDLFAEAGAGLELDALRLGARLAYELRAHRSTAQAPATASQFRTGARMSLSLPIPVLLSGEVDGLWNIGSGAAARYPFLVRGTVFLGESSLVLEGGQVLDLGPEIGAEDGLLDVRELWTDAPEVSAREYWTLGSELQSSFLDGLDVGLGLRYLSVDRLPATGAWDPAVGRYALESLSGNRVEVNADLAWFASPAVLIDASARGVFGTRGESEPGAQIAGGLELGIRDDLVRIRADLSLPVYTGPEVPVLDLQFSLGGRGEAAGAPVSAEIQLLDLLGLAIPGGRGLMGPSTNAGLRDLGFSAGLFVDLSL